MSKPEIETFPSPEALAAAVAGRLVVRLAAVQAAGRTPAVCLTGGTIAVKIHEAVVAATEGHEDVDWSKVDFWWGDERYVPADDDGRNAKQTREVMLDHLDVDERRVHEMPASDGGREGLGGGEGLDLRLRHVSPSWRPWLRPSWWTSSWVSGQPVTRSSPCASRSRRTRRRGRGGAAPRRAARRARGA